jgi:hypothetical protein
MTRTLKQLATLSCMALTLTLSSCIKEKDKLPQVDAETQTRTEDVNDTKDEGDQVNSDVDDALQGFNSFSGGKTDSEAGQKKPICGCTIDSSQLANKILTLNFDGVTPCLSPSRTRSGSIQIALVNQDRWWKQGAMLKITHNNFKVTRLSNNRSIAITGVKYLTNVRGTNILSFFAGTDSLLYRERAQGMQAFITRANGGIGTHVYNIARTTSWRTIKTGIERLQFRAFGDTTIDNIANVDTWGTNRFNAGFVNAYRTPLISNSYCGFWRPVSGEIRHTAGANSATVQFGVNQQGNASQLDCAYGYKVSWQLSTGASGNAVVSY